MKKMVEPKEKELISKVTKEAISKFLISVQEVYPLNHKSLGGKKKWKKVPIKRLSGMTLCLDSEGNPVFQYNDGNQRTGLTVKNMVQFGHMKGQMINNWNKEIDYFTALARYIFNSKESNPDTILSI